MATSHTGLCIAGRCRFCGSDLRDGEYSRVIGFEYGYASPYRYDGVSEWRCPDCSVRINRWTGEVLGPLEVATFDRNVRLTNAAT